MLIKRIPQPFNSSISHHDTINGTSKYLFHQSVQLRLNYACAYPPVQESRPKPPTKRSQPALLKNIIISVKPQAKKPKVEAEAKAAPEERPSNGHDADQKPPDGTKATLSSLVAYDDDDESGEDDD